MLERLAELSAMTTSGLATSRVLDLVTEFVREVEAADMAVMLVPDPSGADRLILKSIGSQLGAGRRTAAGAPGASCSRSTRRCAAAG